MRMGIKSLHILTFARWTFSHMSDVEFSSLQYINSMSTHKELLTWRAGTCRPFVTAALTDGLCTFPTWQQLGTIREGMDRPSCYWVTLLQPARRAAVSGQISSLPPHWSNNLSYTKINISTVQNRMYMYSTPLLPSTGKFLAIGQIQRRRKGTLLS